MCANVPCAVSLLAEVLMQYGATVNFSCISICSAAINVTLKYVAIIHCLYLQLSVTLITLSVVVINYSLHNPFIHSFVICTR